MSLQCELILSNLKINLSNNLFLRFNIFNFSNYARYLVKKWGKIPRKCIKGKKKTHIWLSSVQSFGCVYTLCDPMDCSTPGFPVHHQLPELAQTHVHRVGDAIQYG